MKAILRTPPDHDALARLTDSPVYNPLLRTTAVATMLEGGHAENALPQTARAVVNCRLLPDESPDEVEHTLKKVLANEKISVTAIEPAKPSPGSPITPELIRGINAAKEKLWPGLVIIPVMETGASDGLLFRQLGIPTYGISGSAVDIDDNRMHGKDERIGVQDFYDGLEFVYQLIKTLASK